jgi:hypothetical protein
MSNTPTTSSPYQSERQAERKSEQSSSGPFGTEDWWAVWIGLGIIVVAYLLFLSGTSIKWLAVAPAKWSQIDQAASGLAQHLLNYIALFVLFSLAVAALGQRIVQFLPGFLLLFVLSTLISLPAPGRVHQPTTSSLR